MNNLAATRGRRPRRRVIQIAHAHADRQNFMLAYGPSNHMVYDRGSLPDLSLCLLHGPDSGQPVYH